jgi:cation transport regulator ChaB
MQQNCEECMYQQGAKHPWHKGRPGEKGGSTSTAPGKAQEATERADRATKIAIETRTPEAYKIAMDYHMRAAKANFEAYLDVREENPEAANSFKRMVSEHEGTAGILERRMKKNGSQYDGLFLNVTGNLPEGGKALWEKVYEANKEKLGEERAAKIAWGAVKQAGWSQDKDGKWVHKNNSELPTYKKGYLPTAMLIGYTFNKGSRTQAEIETTRTYIQQHGVTKPVWVQCNGSIKILDGNHRVALADELHIEQIPVRVVDSDLNTMDPEAVYRRWLYEQDQGYLE